MLAKMSHFFRPKCSGSPRYFPIPPSLGIFSSVLTLLLTSGEVFEEKVMVDFSWLIHCPDASSYLRRIERSVAQFAAVDFPKNIVSSANKRWLIGGQFRAIFIPGSAPTNLYLELVGITLFIRCRQLKHMEYNKSTLYTLFILNHFISNMFIFPHVTVYSSLCSLWNSRGRSQILSTCVYICES